VVLCGWGGGCVVVQKGPKNQVHERLNHTLEVTAYRHTLPGRVYGGLQPLSKPQDIALRLQDRLKAAAAEELDIHRALDNLPGWSLPR
jgi:hypothetical protein